MYNGHNAAVGAYIVSNTISGLQNLVDWDNSGGFVFCLVHSDGKHPVLQFRRNVASVHRAGEPYSPGE